MTNQPFENQPPQGAPQTPPPAAPQMPPPGYPPQGAVPGYQQQPPPGYQQPPPGYPNAAMTPQQQDAEQNKMHGILSYLSLLWLVPFLSGPKDTSPFTKFHLNQGLILLVCQGGMIALNIILTVIFPPLLVITSLIGLAITVFAIIGIINAAQGKMAPLPLIGGWTLLK